MIIQSSKCKRLLTIAIGRAPASSVPSIGWAQRPFVAKGRPMSTATHRTHTDKAGSYAPVRLPPGEGRFLVGGKEIGYRDIDFEATESFKIYGNRNACVRVEPRHAFNWNNYVNYIETINNDGVLNKRQVICNSAGDITG